MAAPRIVIGVDFGTTYSGVAWATSNKPEQINTITNWNSKLNRNSDKEKAPTAISYSSSPPSWGYSTPLDEDPVQWFKLLLLDEEDLQSQLRSSTQVTAMRSRLEQLNKNVVEVIADFLKELWAHVLVNIKRTIGQEILDLSSLHVVVTLPAIWPAYAQGRMREAAAVAGILNRRPAGKTELSFISEPEAAALATMSDLSGRPDIQENDHFIVCDAGGGTVDIITYMVVKTSPMNVRESVKGDGKLCGAIFLDEGFSSRLRRKMPRGALRALEAQFCDDGTSWPVRMPYVTGSGSPQVVFDNAEILNIYKPVVAEILELVSAQISQVKRKYRKRPKFVILVGGFGKSRYLYQYLGLNIGEQIQILQGTGERPWTAICRGATMHGLNGGPGRNSLAVAVKSRLARQSYGTAFNLIPWDGAEHHPADKAWCPIQQQFLAVDQIKWFLRIGEEVESSKPVCHSFWQDLDAPLEEVVSELVVSDDLVPPSRLTGSVRKLCLIKWTDIPDFGKLPMWKNGSGKVVRQICYDVKMFTDGGSLDFAVYYEGKRVASKNVSVSYETESGTD
ncbi:hypothetical protein S40293_08558 [Stachybotrys chartarum IBT 40293]|nr:hypothetical protein S40293_08558 [Stachybotrys chartarum IBT 40293]